MQSLHSRSSAPSASNGPLVLANLLNTSFNGTTGTVRFRPDGDRSLVGLRYILENFVWVEGALSLVSGVFNSGRLEFNASSRPRLFSPRSR